MSLILISTITRPLRLVATAIYHIEPSNKLTTPPNIDNIKFGRELTSSLVRQIYDMAGSKGSPITTTNNEPILDLINMPIVGLDEQGIIKLANSHAVKLSGHSESILNKRFSEIFNLDESDNKINDWINSTSSSQITNTKSWLRVGLAGKSSDNYHYYDLSASYSKHSSAGTDTLLCFFDQMEKYSDEDDSFWFIALAVHELRTPLT
ncbi:MAG: PAS domain-containing protein, partial [Patescibacteria group bacterium]